MVLRLILALLLSICMVPGALAQNIRYSSLPYWEVGVLDPQLSTLCSGGQFNMADAHAFSYVFRGSVGSAVLGVAKTDWNLVDTSGAAKPGTSYYFLRDRTTNCQVFRWGPNDQRRTMGPPSDFGAKDAKDLKFKFVTDPSSAEAAPSGINKSIN